MNFKPIKTKKIYEEIIDQIKEMLSDGTLKSGDKIMAERELAEQLQVGRSAVREAFRALEVMGLIEIRPGEGTYVRDCNTHNMIEPLALIMMMERNTPEDIFEMRRILEVQAGGLAAQRRTDEELKRMERALEEMEQDLQNGQLGEQADMDFHYAIADASHNSVIVRIMHTVSDSMREAFKRNRQILFSAPGRPKILLGQHRAIFEGIKKGDPELTMKMINFHLDFAEKGMMEKG